MKAANRAAKRDAETLKEYMDIFERVADRITKATHGQ